MIPRILAASVALLALMGGGRTDSFAHGVSANVRWKEGVNYWRIKHVGARASRTDKIEVVEFFWYGCPNCYAFEPYLVRWNAAKHPQVTLVRVPDTWRPAHRAHAQLYYTLKALGREDLQQSVYDEIHKKYNPLVGQNDEQTFKSQRAFAVSHGINAAKFTEKYYSAEIEDEMRHAGERSDRYMVDSVPTVIIGDEYSANVESAGGSQAGLIELVNFLIDIQDDR
jgi:thiol:disulfide interchange protein DsbA